MAEISNNYAVTQPQIVQEESQNKRYAGQRTMRNTIHDEFWRKEKRKNTGLIERFYNSIKNITGLGTGSHKVERALNQVKKGEISQAEFKKTVQDYNSSQETSAQALGDLMSVGAAGLTYFGLRNDAKLHFSGKQLNEKFGSTNALAEAAETMSGGFNLRTIKKMYSKLLAKAATSKTKLAIFTAGIAALVGGTTKLHVLQLNRIGSQEFKTDKKEFNGAKTEHDKLLYKVKKKMNRSEKQEANFRNFASGAVNGLLMPISIIGGAIVGIPAYFVGNSLNRYFIGQKHNEKTAGGYFNNLVNDGVTHTVLGAATLIPMIKKGRFSSTFDKNLELAFKEINSHDVLKDNPYGGKSAYQEINDIMFENPAIKNIIESGKKKDGMSVIEQIKALSDENIFAVKLKQIENSHRDLLSEALVEDCPSTRTLEEAAKEIQSKLGNGYKVKVNMGTGTIAETYLVETPEGKEVCVKMLKKGIDADKINRDKQKFIDIVNGLKDRSDAEKQYLIKNIENLADGVSKEIDFRNEMEAAKKLVDYTKTAHVVKPIEVKNGLYVMEKADGMSLSKLLKTMYPENYIHRLEESLKKAKTQTEKDYYKNKIAEFKKLAEKKSNILTEKDADYMLDEYMNVLVEQLYKTDKAGRTLHADIHPGNIFIDTKAIKERKGNAFTLIDTGNTVNLTAEQTERSMKLTQYIEHGDTKDLAKYFIENANLSESKLTKEEAEKKIEEALNEVFFSSDIRLNTMSNSEIINLTSNIMKQHKIMPGDTQLNLEKARTSAANSYYNMLGIWADQAFSNALDNKNKAKLTVSVLDKFRQLMSKWNKYLELQQEQEKENLWQMIKSPKKFFQSQLNPNYKEKNSKEYLIYHLKQDIKKEQ